MRCSKCGQENEDNAKYCDSCGIELFKSESNMTISYSKNEVKKTDITALILSVITSVVGGIISVVGGYKMTQIKSVAGDSIAESFYNSFGVFAIGFGLFMIAIGMYIYHKSIE